MRKIGGHESRFDSGSEPGLASIDTTVPPPIGMDTLVSLRTLPICRLVRLVATDRQTTRECPSGYRTDHGIGYRFSAACDDRPQWLVGANMAVAVTPRAAAAFRYSRGKMDRARVGSRS